MAITEAGGGYTPIMTAGAITAPPGLPERGVAGAAAHATSPARASR